MPDAPRNMGDQSIVRLVRQAITRFDALPESDIEGKLRCILLVSSLAAAGMITNHQMRLSTVSFVVGRI